MSEERQPTTKFIDAKGDGWDVALDAVLIQKVRDEHSLDLAEVTAPETWRRLDGDLVLQVNVLHTLLAATCEARGMNPTDFARALGPGDVLDNAYMALLDAIENFIPPKRRLLWRTMVRKNQALMEKGLTLAIQKVNSPQLEQQVLEAAGNAMDSAVETQLTRLRSATDGPPS